MIETFREFTFEAAHPTIPATPLHGQTLEVKVALTEGWRRSSAGRTACSRSGR